MDWSSGLRELWECRGLDRHGAVQTFEKTNGGHVTGRRQYRSCCRWSRGAAELCRGVQSAYRREGDEATEDGVVRAVVTTTQPGACRVQRLVADDFAAVSGCHDAVEVVAAVSDAEARLFINVTLVLDLPGRLIRRENEALVVVQRVWSGATPRWRLAEFGRGASRSRCCVRPYCLPSCPCALLPCAVLHRAQRWKLYICTHSLAAWHVSRM